MRRRESLTPEQQRELDAIDRALAEQPVELDLRELEELVHDVRVTAPEMTPAFAARLEHDVAEGFPAPREQPSAGERLRGPGGRRWLLLPALGSLAAVLVALVVVLGGEGSEQITEFGSQSRSLPAQDGASSGGGGVAADEAATPPAPAAAMPGSPAASTVARPADEQAVAGVTQTERKVQRSASIALETPAGDFARTNAAVNTTVARFGGIVASSQVGESDASGGEATYDLRIPTDRLDRALAALAKLGHVTESSRSLDDITGSFTSAQEQLTDARAERRGLLRALERATTQQQIDSLKARLRSAGSRISGLKGRLAALRRRADLATVSLTVRGTGEQTEAGGGGSWTPGDAAGDAVRVLEVVAGVLLIALAVLLPVGLIAAAIGLGVRAGRRRRRDAALDPA